MCGNFGLLAFAEQTAERKAHDDLLRAMAKLTELRGALGGGLAAVAWNHVDAVALKSSRVRVIQSKREFLSDVLLRRFAAETSPKLPSTMAILGHTRYPTSSRSVEHELHPHVWCQHKKEPMWLSTKSGGTPTIKASALRGIAISHNGDFDEYDLFGSRVSNALVGRWLTCVLGEANTCVGDSPKVAGMLDLMCTKGSWTSSVRLAFQLTVATTVADAANGDPNVSLGARCTAPSIQWCQTVGRLFEAVMVDVLGAPKSAAHDGGESGQDLASLERNLLFATREAAATTWDALEEVPPDLLDGFVRVTVERFLKGDLFAAMTEFIKNAHGSFGLQAISAGDPYTACIAAKGQAMRLAVIPSAKVAIWGSEGTAVEVPIPMHPQRFVMRLDSINGQVVEIKYSSPGSAASNGSEFAVGPFRIQSIHLGNSEYDTATSVKRQFRFVETPLFTPLLVRDPVLEDIRAIPATLELVSSKWRANMPASFNVRSAKAFIEKFSAAMSKPHKLHLLVVGIEVSLFVAEQFAADVVEFIPGANAKAVSANQIVGGEKIYFSARDSKGTLSMSQLSQRHTVVLIVSQSGQTFPSLKATARLVQRLGDRVFVLVGGEEDTAPYSEMGSVIMDHHRIHAGRDGRDHVFCNMSGLRPCEPSSLALAATFHTLTELLIFMRFEFKRPITTAEVDRRAEEQLCKDFREAVNGFRAPALLNMEEIVGRDLKGDLTPGGMKMSTTQKWGSLFGLAKPAISKSDVHVDLVMQGRRWGQHISEPWRIMFLTGTYIIVTIVLAAPFCRCLLHFALAIARKPYSPCWYGVGALTFDFGLGALGGSERACPPVAVIVGTAVALIDCLIYIMFPVFVGRLLRWAEGRSVNHRFGKRTVVIADVPWVANCAEQFASRLYSLAYGFASPDVHHADPVDDLIHRFGHRSVRGLLLLVGRPDGRLFAFTKTESAVLLSTKQISFVENRGEMPEAVTVGSNPHKEAITHNHITIPSSSRPRFLDELMYSRLIEQEEKQASMARMMTATGSPELPRVSTRRFLRALQRIFETASPMDAGVIGLTSLRDSEFDQSMGRGEVRSDMSLQAAQIIVQSSSIWDSHMNASDSVLRVAEQYSEPVAPGEASAFQANLDKKTGTFFSSFYLSQRFLEARFNALERFVAFCVVFHSSATEANRGLWGLPAWDISRSQSHMRVNTTACPILSVDDDDDYLFEVALNERLGLLNNVPILQKLPIESQDKILASSAIIYFSPGSKITTIEAPVTSVLVIRSGQAGLFYNGQNQTGSEQTDNTSREAFPIFAPGDVIGGSSILQRGNEPKHTQDFFALTEVVCLSIPHESFVLILDVGSSLGTSI